MSDPRPDTLGEEQLRLALDAAHAGVWVWNVTTDLVTWSDRLYEFHRLAPGSFGGRSRDFLALVAPDDREAVSAAIGSALQGHREYRIDFRTLWPSGEIRYLSTSARLLRDDQGRPERMIGVTFDVTDRKRIEDEQRRLLEATEAARREAEDANLVRERLISMVGHDLRTPLSAITLGVAALSMRTRDTLGPEDRRIVDRINSSAARMARMITDVVDFAASRRAGGLSIYPQPTDLRELCRRVAEETEVAHPGARVQVAPTGPMVVACDSDRISQVLSNLLTNAHQYGAAAPISVRLTGTEQTVLVQVHNQGDPIAPENLEAIFEPFARGTTRRSAQNLGLGLYICREIVRAHQGRLDVRSDDSGTTFTVSLPREIPRTGREA